MRRPCLGAGGIRCPRLTEGAARCPEHARLYERIRRPAPRVRGYDTEYQHRRAEVLHAEPWCHRVSGCPYSDAGTVRNPLTADHLVAVVRGGADGPLTVLCRRCNSAKQEREARHPLRGEVDTGVGLLPPDPAQVAEAPPNPENS